MASTTEKPLHIKPNASTGLLLVHTIFLSLPLLIFFAFMLTIPLIIFSLVLDSIPAIFITIATIAVIIYMCVFILIFLVRRKVFLETNYKIYTDRIEYKEGFLRKNKKTVHFKNVSNIGQTSSIVQQWFKVGTIFIDTAGTSYRGHELVLHHIDNTDEIYDKLSKKINK
ncbi:MAG: PH domain-containing protein [Nanobdellota archaeon]